MFSVKSLLVIFPPPLFIHRINLHYSTLRRKIASISPNFSLSDDDTHARRFASVYSLSNKISLLATTLASRVFGLFGFCWSPVSGAGPGTGIAEPVVPKLAACGSPFGDIAPFAFCSVFSFFVSVTEKKFRHRSEPWRDICVVKEAD